MLLQHYYCPVCRKGTKGTTPCSIHTTIVLSPKLRIPRKNASKKQWQQFEALLPKLPADSNDLSNPDYIASLSESQWYGILCSDTISLGDKVVALFALPAATKNGYQRLYHLFNTFPVEFAKFTPILLDRLLSRLFAQSHYFDITKDDPLNPNEVPLFNEDFIKLLTLLINGARNTYNTHYSAVLTLLVSLCKSPHFEACLAQFLKLPPPSGDIQPFPINITDTFDDKPILSYYLYIWPILTRLLPEHLLHNVRRAHVEHCLELLQTPTLTPKQIHFLETNRALIMPYLRLHQARISPIHIDKVITRLELPIHEVLDIMT